MNTHIVCDETTIFIKQFEIPMTSNISYYIESGGVAAVVDPFRDISVYTEILQERSSKLALILLTRIASDYIQGHFELSKKTNAQVVVGCSGQNQLDVKIAEDGEEIGLGYSKVRILLTPGVSQESCCYVLEEIQDSGNIQKYLFSGDTLLLGDYCTPDTTIFISQEQIEENSAILYESLHQKIILLNENIIVLPSHGFGFRMAKYTIKGNKDLLKNQKLINLGLCLTEKSRFIEHTLNKVVQHPFSYRYILECNSTKNFLQLQENFKETISLLKPIEMLQYQKKGTVIIDTRVPQEFQNSFIDGSINISLSTKLELWIGILYEPNKYNFIVIAEDNQNDEVLKRFSRIGYDKFIVGILQGGFSNYVQSGFLTTKIEQIDPLEFKENLFPYKPQIMDVRDEREYNSGYIEFSNNIPISRIPDIFKDINRIFDKTKPIYVFCNGGGRAAIGCSILRAHGFQYVFNIRGGMSKLKEVNTTILTNQ